MCVIILGDLSTIPNQLRYLRFASLHPLLCQSLENKMKRIGESIRDHAYQTVMDSIEREHELLIQEIKNKMAPNDNSNDNNAENFPNTLHVYRLEGSDAQKPLSKPDALRTMQALCKNDFAALVRSDDNSNRSSH